MRRSATILFAILLATGLTVRGSAQVTGLPTRNNGISTGLTIGG